ncbi:MAG: DUF5658 family protein [Thermodesulfovibrionia bacterium]|nr:DUF5658 family protein [Thermodesulfovibrionia bacterium]
MSINITNKRVLSDRRKRPNHLINRYTLIGIGGKRKAIRRETDKKNLFLLDYYSPRLLIILLSILLLSYVDAYLTLVLIKTNIIVEVNPLMAFHLEQGVMPFILNKFFLTAGSLIILCLFQNNYIAKKGLKFILTVYIAIITYQLYLTHITH